MSTLIQDIRYAARTLRKQWGVMTVAVVSLALAIGGNAAVFSMVEAFLLRPLPIPESERLVILGERPDDQPAQTQLRTMSLRTWADLAERSRTLSEVAALQPRTLALRGEERSDPVSSMMVSPNYFEILQAPIAQGRGFLPEEGVEGARRVAMITEAFRQERFGDQVPVGEVMRLNGDPHEIIGIVPEGFDILFSSPDIYVPLTRSPQGAARDQRNMFALASLAPASNMDLVRAELAQISTELSQEFPETQKGWTFDAFNLRYDIPPTQTKILFALLQGTVLVVLLIACVNVTNLLLARGQERGREIALRAVLGATRGRIVRQLLTESMFLGILGGLFGLGLGRLGVTAIARNFAGLLPPNFTPSMNMTVVLFSVGVAVGAGVLFGMMPALQTLKRDHASTLREGGGRGGGGRSRKPLSKILVVGEIALSMIALGVGSLMVRSFLQIRSSDPGYDGSDVLTATVSVPQSRYSEDADQVLLIEQILERVQALQGVRSAALSSGLPQGFQAAADTLEIAGRQGPDGASGWPTMRIAASPGYLETLDIELVQGRFFEDADRDAAAPVAVVNRTLAERHFPGRSPLGERVTVDDVSREVVGVVGDVQQVLVASGAAAQSGEAVYVPAAQRPGGVRQLTLEASGDPKQLEAPLRSSLQLIDPDLTLPQVLTDEERIDQAFVGINVFNVILGGFGAIALFMAALGTYGVLAYSVSQRRHEIGIRMAVGARPGNVVRMISRQGLWLGVVGLAVGLLATLPLARLVENTLSTFATVQHSTLVAIAALLMAVTVAASFLPAWRAARVDPVKTLREE